MEILIAQELKDGEEIEQQFKEIRIAERGKYIAQITTFLEYTRKYYEGAVSKLERQIEDLEKLVSFLKQIKGLIHAQCDLNKRRLKEFDPEKLEKLNKFIKSKTRQERYEEINELLALDLIQGTELGPEQERISGKIKEIEQEVIQIRNDNEQPIRQSCNHVFEALDKLKGLPFDATESDADNSHKYLSSFNRLLCMLEKMVKNSRDYHKGMLGNLCYKYEQMISDHDESLKEIKELLIQVEAMIDAKDLAGLAKIAPDLDELEISEETKAHLGLSNVKKNEFNIEDDKIPDMTQDELEKFIKEKEAEGEDTRHFHVVFQKRKFKQAYKSLLESIRLDTEKTETNNEQINKISEAEDALEELRKLGIVDFRLWVRVAALKNLLLDTKV